MMMLSRNKPVTYLVGVAGFLGSHLAEKLLAKNIQVIGVDNLSTGRKEYLEHSSKDKNFHFLNQSASFELTFDFPRLDYAFFIISENLDEEEYKKSLENFINLAKKFKPKVVYVSSLGLYDSHDEKYPNLKEAEKKLAQLSLEHQLNTRIIRLAAVYGPRMHFREEDPICRLIYAASCGEIQKENTTLDFTTRGLYIDDAVDLLIKAVMHGATAQKLYDGALLYPLKVMEIKQLLLDPLWYESRGFVPTQLPPWPTPNILKTQKELSWASQASLTAALKQTLHFFQQFPHYLPKSKLPEAEKVEHPKEISEDKLPLPEEKKQQIKELFGDGPENNKPEVRKGGGVRWQKIRGYLGLICLLGLLFYATVYPLTLVVLSGLNVKDRLSQSYQDSKAGDYQQAKRETYQAQLAVGELKSNLSALKLFRAVGLFTTTIQATSQLTEILEKTIDGVQAQSVGQAALVESLKVISGGKEGDLNKLYLEAEASFNQAEESLGLVQGRLSDPVFISSTIEVWPFFKDILQANLMGLGKRMAETGQSLQREKLLSQVLPGLIPPSGKRSYLILLADSSISRPRGGVINSYGEIIFEDGRLQKINIEDIAKIEEDSDKLAEPPKEAKELIMASLKDSNFEADFPTAARNAAWGYQRQSGQPVSGVILIDEKGLAGVSPILGEGLKEVLNNLFFSPQLNYSNLGSLLNQMLEEKHLVVYVSDPVIYGYLDAQGFTGSLPRQSKEKVGERQDFSSF
ncbi:MAG: NAD-dependent epimerase/dehydratase [Candidatus Daviesbacteria bacterium GW2011_GWA1_41_61]|uniref:NAD-dependent epimerase/dehydratase n=1 Tax=Candidatus Daviesbacteria bacterium GW2011_GWA2_40_9 TaxID=1618424 RepID=A0A0G0U0U3_9BACT|nr:MAG: NAD-dependent epimerase/dehydratase [Candidatus Daviesbacteria bacterium GW2011_GWC1_40_9]KKR82754.1 MAG: NAD-dependent epimerase/dehydratase [Candidatus Daviesbacteria bacterium GW2011_GWA2_40_9]KKR93780.1 MAG: NAD-dependent epimerase/dehydratase [Candidatus Daviesbacteria bacterium GW2011_GWB1_41_15]KKS15246.1 MAG: NAD-dependent epimerase/dehydratase [Candidatus Daviesbacteria bacterium GW2011_GWA1_41_61]